MSKIIQYTYRYEVHFRGADTEWIIDTSFKFRSRAKRYIKSRQAYQPWEYRLVDTKIKGEIDANDY